MNFENAIRGMRNALNSWDKSDSFWGCTVFGKTKKCNECYVQNKCCTAIELRQYHIGENDLKLANTLCKAGPDHRKFMRQIFVSVDITAPLYWWKEYDTYKVGTTANSCSTMHTLHKRDLTLEDFSLEYVDAGDSDWYAMDIFLSLLDVINTLRKDYLKFKDKDDWYAMIQLLQSSYNQMRTCTMTYENLRSMYHARKNHKLSEWQDFCSWVESLPYAQELIVSIGNKEES